MNSLWNESKWSRFTLCNIGCLVHHRLQDKIIKGDQHKTYFVSVYFFSFSYFILSLAYNDTHAMSYLINAKIEWLLATLTLLYLELGWSKIYKSFSNLGRTKIFENSFTFAFVLHQELYLMTSSGFFSSREFGKFITVIIIIMLILPLVYIYIYIYVFEKWLYIAGFYHGKRTYRRTMGRVCEDCYRFSWISSRNWFFIFHSP